MGVLRGIRASYTKWVVAGGPAQPACSTSLRIRGAAACPPYKITASARACRHARSGMVAMRWRRGLGSVNPDRVEISRACSQSRNALAGDGVVRTRHLAPDPARREQCTAGAAAPAGPPRWDQRRCSSRRCPAEAGSPRVRQCRPSRGQRTRWVEAMATLERRRRVLESRRRGTDPVSSQVRRGAPAHHLGRGRGNEPLAVPVVTVAEVACLAAGSGWWE